MVLNRGSLEVCEREGLNVFLLFSINPSSNMNTPVEIGTYSIP